eukprot:4299041-Amphidinium_carterae.1
MGPIAYRDDLAIGLWGHTNQELLEKLIRMTHIVKRVHEDFHLVINLATTKTEATVSLCKPDAQSIWQGMRLVGHARGLSHPAVALDEVTTLSITQTYPHLGCIHAQSLALKGEIMQMICRCRSAVTSKKPALKTRRLKVATRLALYNCYARCHLLQNIAVLQPFTAAESKRVRAEYFRGLRICTDQVVEHSGVTKLSNAAIMEKYKVHDLETLMEKRVLTFFIRLATVDNELVRAALSATFAKQSLWTRVFQALNNLHRTVPTVLADLPVASKTTVDQWTQFVVWDIGRWKAIVKGYKGVSTTAANAETYYDDDEMQIDADHEVTPETDGLAEGLAAIIEEEEDLYKFACDECAYRGKTNAALQAHRRRAHQAFSELSMRVKDATCVACDLNFGLRTRVLDHFRQSPRCGAYVLANVPPMSPRTFEKVRLETKNQNDTQSRLL